MQIGKLSGLGHIVKLPQGTNASEYVFPQYDPRIHQFYVLNLYYIVSELIYEKTFLIFKIIIFQ